MSKFHIIGTGACGFLRMNYILRDYIPLRYKGGRGKYQNSFETWSDNELSQKCIDSIFHQPLIPSVSEQWGNPMIDGMNESVCVQ